MLAQRTAVEAKGKSKKRINPTLPREVVRSRAHQQPLCSPLDSKIGSLRDLGTGACAAEEAREEATAGLGLLRWLLAIRKLLFHRKRQVGVVHCLVRLGRRLRHVDNRSAGGTVIALN